MLESNESEQERSSESFPDEASGDGSFRLEKLEKYPTDLPYDPTQADGQAVSDSGPIAVSPTLVATIKEDLERSRIQKTRHDTLEESIQRLKGKLQSDDSLYTDNSESSQLASDDDLLNDEDLSASNELQEHPVFNEQPVMISTGDMDTPQSSTPISIDVAGLPDPQSAESKANNSSEIESMNDEPDVSSRMKPRRLVYGLVGVVLLAMLGAGTWFVLNRPTSPNPQAANPAQSLQSAKANGEAEALTKKSPDGAVDEHATASSQNTATASPSVEQEKIAESHDGSVANAAHQESNQTSTKKETEIPKTESAALSQKSHNEPTSTTATAPTEKKPVSTATTKDDKHSPLKAKDEKSSVRTPSSASTASVKNSATEKQSAQPSAMKTVQPKTAIKSGNIASNDTRNSAASSPNLGVNPMSSEPSTTASKSTAKEEGKKVKESHDKSGATASGVPATQPAKDAAARDKQSSAKNPSIVEADSKKSSQYETKLIAKPVIKNVPASPKGVFTVQVYSTPNQEDADDWMHRLQKKNVDGAFVSKQNVRGTTYYRVRFGQYTTKQEAESAAMNSGFHSSWVDRVK